MGSHKNIFGQGAWRANGRLRVGGEAQGQIRGGIEFLCSGKTAGERAVISDELVALVRSIVRGDYPEPQTSPLEREQHARENWARMSAHHIVDGALAASERSDGPHPSEDQVALLREIARRALWHIPNSADEVRSLVRYVTMENLRQPNPFDDEAPGG